MVDYSDGVLTLEEFAAAVAARPLDEIPVEHDADAIISAEFVALAFRRMGMLPNLPSRLQRSRITRGGRKAVGERERAPATTTATTTTATTTPILRRQPPGTATCGGAELEVPHKSIHHFLPSTFSSLQTSPPLVFANGQLSSECYLQLPESVAPAAQ